jgi:16S rRNA (guanine527-N7)-methyltransferase
VASAFLERWLEDVVSTPGLTAIPDLAEARRVLLDDALRALPVIREEPGAIVDVGSGGGSPGIPLALMLPDRTFVLLEAERRKSEFLGTVVSSLVNVDVVWGRAETQPLECYGVALAKALAKPPVAAELCLPLVRQSGVVVLWVGPTADRALVEAVASRLGGALEPGPEGLLVIRKLEPTPEGFPRRPGMAKKRPLA